LYYFDRLNSVQHDSTMLQSQQHRLIGLKTKTGAICSYSGNFFRSNLHIYRHCQFIQELQGKLNCLHWYCSYLEKTKTESVSCQIFVCFRIKCAHRYWSQSLQTQLRH